MEYTDEQQAVIDSDGDIKVNAIAGSGKTSTLVGYCKARPDKRILYLVFNKSAKEDAIRKFEGVNNVKIMSAHGLAYRYTIPNSGYCITNNLSIMDIKKYLNMEDLEGVGKLNGYVIASHVSKYLALYLNSTERKVEDVDYKETLDTKDSEDFCDQYYEMIQTGVYEVLKRMKNREIDITHDYYMKIFHLRIDQYKLPYDIILYDEFQDTNPLMVDIFAKQDCTKVCTGDVSQAIYGWRGALNSLSEVNFKEFPLTKSFRFDQTIADKAIEVLKMKQMYNPSFMVNKMVGLGSSEGEIKTYAVLARKNFSLLKHAIDTIKEKPRTKMYFEGGLGTYTVMAGSEMTLNDVYNLYFGDKRYIRSPLAKTFEDTKELETYVERSEDKNLSLLINVVKEYGYDLMKLIDKLWKSQVKDRSKAKIIYSTIHKAKGLEYDKVVLCPDFITKEQVFSYAQDVADNETEKRLDEASIDESINIYYVAVTRAKKKLIILAPPPKVVIEPDKGTMDLMATVNAAEFTARGVFGPNRGIEDEDMDHDSHRYGR